jgi:hypothetical protein
MKMTMFPCICCNKELEGLVFDENTLMKAVNGIYLMPQEKGSLIVPMHFTMIRLASPEQWPTIIKEIVIGIQCKKCKSWICTDDISPLMKKDYWGPHIICPKCGKKSPFWDQILLSLNYASKIINNNDTIRAKWYMGIIPPNEEFILDGGSLDNMLIFTDKHFFTGRLGQLNMRLYDEINYVTICLANTGVYIALGMQGQASYEMYPIVYSKEFNSKIRGICERIKLPFAIQVKPKEEVEKILGYTSSSVFIDYFVGKNIQWPQKCARCLTPVSDSAINFDHLVIWDAGGLSSTGKLLVDVSWDILSQKDYGKQPNVSLDIPYCPSCANQNLKSIAGYCYAMGQVTLEFDNEEYAKLFIQLNAST